MSFVLRRTLQEDRTLREQLQPYAAYAQWVRYRLFPERVKRRDTNGLNITSA